MAFVDAEVIVPIGKRLSYSTTVNGTYTTIFGTTKITPPEQEIGKAEYTNDDSPRAATGGTTGPVVKQYKSATMEPGTVKASYVYQPTQFAAIALVAATGQTLYWKLLTPDNKVRTFQGFIAKHSEGELGLDDVPDIDLEIQVSGPVTAPAAVTA